MSSKSNKARKVKLDLVASSIEERNITWTHREDPGYTFVFILKGAEIHVSHEEIKMKKDGEIIGFFDKKFIEELDSLQE